MSSGCDNYSHRAIFLRCTKIGKEFSLKILIIIVSWNVKELVGKCIKSINKYMDVEDYEIVLVDNASHDNTADFVQKVFPKVRVITNKTNVGFAAANNQAIRTTDADVLILANPDTELTCSVSSLIAHVSEDRHTAVAFGRLIYPDGSTQEFIRNFPTVLNQVSEIFGLAHLFPNAMWACEMVRRKNNRVYLEPHFIDSGSGAFFVMKRDVFLRAGMFDEDYFVYGEETDLFFRLNKLGYKIFYDPTVEIVHHHGKSTSQNPMMYAMLQKNRYLFIKKHYSRKHAAAYRYFCLLPYDCTRYLLSILRCFVLKGRTREESCDKARRHLGALLWELCG